MGYIYIQKGCQYFLWWPWHSEWKPAGLPVNTPLLFRHDAPQVGQLFGHYSRRKPWVGPAQRSGICLVTLLVWMNLSTYPNLVKALYKLHTHLRYNLLFMRQNMIKPFTHFFFFRPETAWPFLEAFLWWPFHPFFIWMSWFGLQVMSSECLSSSLLWEKAGLSLPRVQC